MDNPTLIAVSVPILLLLAGAAARKIVRGAGWQRHDFFLGIEFTLAAMTAALIQLFDLGRQAPQIAQQKVTQCGFFLVVCFLLLLFVLSAHQDWATKNEARTKQIIWLGLMANFIGFSLLTIFILWVK